jgi:hypothetical protein
MGWMDAIENSAIAIWVRESPSIFAYTTVLSLHAMGLAMVVGINVLVALRLLGYVPEIPAASLRKLFPWMYVGFTVNAVSGLLLLAASLSTNLFKVMFILKLCFILLAMINLELMRAKVFGGAQALAGGEIVVDEQGARKFAWASIVLWGLAIITGRLTSYPNFVQAVFGF